MTDTDHISAHSALAEDEDTANISLDDTAPIADAAVDAQPHETPRPNTLHTVLAKFLYVLAGLWAFGTALLFGLGYLPLDTASPMTVIGDVGMLTVPFFGLVLTALLLQLRSVITMPGGQFADALAPMARAEQRLVHLQKRLQTELHTLNGVTDLAAERIEHLETRFQSEISSLFTATQETEARAAAIANTLQSERSALAKLGHDLVDQLETLRAKIGDIGGEVQTANHAVEDITGSLEKSVADSISALIGTTETVDERLAAALNHMEDRHAAIDAASTDIAARLTDVSDRMREESQHVREEMSQVEGHTQTLTARLETQAKTLGEMSASAALQAAKIEASLHAQNSAMEAIADSAQTRSDDIVERLQGVGDEVQQAIAAAEHGIARIAQATSVHADSIDVRLTQALAQSESMLQRAADQLSEHSRTAVQEAETAAEQTLARLRQVRGNIEFEIESLGDRAADISTQITMQSGDIVQAAEHLAQRANHLDQNLGTTRTHIDDQTRAMIEALQDAQSRLDAMEAEMQSQRDALASLGSESASLIDAAAQSFALQAQSMTEAATMADQLLTQQANALAGKIDALEHAGKDAHTSLDLSSMSLKQAASDLRQEMAQSRTALGSAADAFANERMRIQLDTDQVLGRIHSASSAMSREVEKFSAQSQSTADELERATETTKAMAAATHSAITETIEKTQIKLSTGLDSLTDAAHYRVKALQADLDTTMTRLLDDYHKSTAFAERESASLSTRLGKDAAEIERKAKDLLDISDTLKKRLADTARKEFSKTSKLLVQSLQAASIDINRALEVDIPDDQWSAYLNGDKSLFMRKTLQIADKKTKAKIAEKYTDDLDFKDIVERYLRDFEGLMQQSMHGDTAGELSVTLISSDMGKLYVMLGQSVKRFN